MEIYHSAWWIPSTWWILHGYGSLLECQLLTLSPINKVESVENDHFGDKQLIFQGPGISTKITKLSLNHDYRRNGKWKKNVLPKMKKNGGVKKTSCKTLNDTNPHPAFLSQQKLWFWIWQVIRSSLGTKRWSTHFCQIVAFTCNSITSHH